MSETVCNLKTATPETIADGVRIDRRTRWGNPFPIGPGMSRLKVIELYRRKLWSDIKSGAVRLEDLAALKGKQLLCHCAP